MTACGTRTPPPHNPAFVRNWSLRCRDLIDKYRPDLLYFDDTGLPLGTSRPRYRGAVLQFQPIAGTRPLGSRGQRQRTADREQRHALVEDVERGFSDVLRPLPWQTDTCIGNWHYDRPLFERHGYKSAASVITRLCDIVSKNGNLMLSVPMRGDGTIDSDEVAVLEALAKWMNVNGEAIFGTRPWKVFGEGPTQVKAGMFGENQASPFTADDIRFTTRQSNLYAIALGRPTAAALTVRSLARLAADQVQNVRLLGMETGLRFRQESQGLTILLPDSLPGAMAYAFKISGSGLT